MLDQLNEAWTLLTEKIIGMLKGLVLLLPNIVLSVLVAVLGYFSVRYLHKKLRSLLKGHMANETIASILSRVVSFVLMAAILFLILGILNLDQLLTSLLATAGVLGLAVGLALQEPLANAFGGIMLSMRKLYRIGDLVESNDYFGTIKEVNLRTTQMYTPSGQVVSLPNKLVLQNPLVNYSFRGIRRVELDCGVSYAEDLEKVEEVVRETMKSVDYLKEKNLEFFYLEFGGSSITFRIRFWISEVGQASYYRARSAALTAIKKAFDKEGITIPFPIRTLDFGIKGGIPFSAEVQGLNGTESSRSVEKA